MESSIVRDKYTEITEEHVKSRYAMVSDGVKAVCVCIVVGVSKRESY
jgi:hypothetical protein